MSRNSRFLPIRRSLRLPNVPNAALTTLCTAAAAHLANGVTKGDSDLVLCLVSTNYPVKQMSSLTSGWLLMLAAADGSAEMSSLQGFAYVMNSSKIDR